MEGVDVSLASTRLTQKYIQITTAKQHLLHPVCVRACVFVLFVCGKESVNELFKRKKTYPELSKEESLIQRYVLVTFQFCLRLQAAGRWPTSCCCGRLHLMKEVSESMKNAHFITYISLYDSSTGRSWS